MNGVSEFHTQFFIIILNEKGFDAPGADARSRTTQLYILHLGALRFFRGFGLAPHSEHGMVGQPSSASICPIGDLEPMAQKP